MMKFRWIILCIVLLSCIGSCIANEFPGTAVPGGVVDPPVNVATSETYERNSDFTNQGGIWENSGTLLKQEEARVISPNLFAGGGNKCSIEYAALSTDEFQTMVQSENTEGSAVSHSTAALLRSFKNLNPELSDVFSSENIKIATDKMTDQQWATVRADMILNHCDALQGLADGESVVLNENNAFQGESASSQYQNEITTTLEKDVKDAQDEFDRAMSDARNARSVLNGMERLQMLFTPNAQRAQHALFAILARDAWDVLNALNALNAPDSQSMVNADGNLNAQGTLFMLEILKNSIDHLEQKASINQGVLKDLERMLQALEPLREAAEKLIAAEKALEDYNNENNDDGSAFNGISVDAAIFTEIES